MAWRAAGTAELRRALRFATLTGGVCLERLDAAASAELDALSIRCADFMQRVEGRAPAPHEGRQVLTEAPPGFPIADKFVLGVRSLEGLIGVADVLRGYPTAEVWWIGLLLLEPEARGGGLGREIVATLAAWARREGAATLRLGVQTQNERGFLFWRRQGFEHLHTREQRNDRGGSQVRVMERRLG